jgi:metal-responsive CopG/Arc/MetJ family transcriptional regulator
LIKVLICNFAYQKGTRMSNKNGNPPHMVHVGLYLPKTLVTRLDEAKGYYTRNKFVQKITEEYFAGQEMEVLLEEGIVSVATPVASRNKHY